MEKFLNFFNGIVESLNKLSEIYVILFASMFLLTMYVATMNHEVLTIAASGFGAVFGISRQKQKPAQQNFDVANLENLDIKNTGKGEQKE